MRSSTTIAAILLESGPQIAIDMLADAVLSSKSARNANSKSVTWDCEDLVFLDFGSLRIALHDIQETLERPNCVCLAVGPVPGAKLPKFMDSAHIAKGLVAKLTEVLSTSALLWHEDARALCPDVMDDFTYELENMLDHLHMQIEQVRSESAPILNPQQISVMPKPSIKKSTRKSALQDEAALRELRAHLSAKGMVGHAISRPLHVSIYVMAGTFLLMVPAIGSALFSYIALRDGLDKAANEA